MKALDVSRHAFQRAQERIALDPGGFLSWVDATKWRWQRRTWEFFEAHGCCVRRQDMLYYCPWTPDIGLCLPVSEDWTLKTVMVFDQGSVEDETPRAPNHSVFLKEIAYWKGRHDSLPNDEKLQCWRNRVNKLKAKVRKLKTERDGLRERANLADCLIKKTLEDTSTQSPTTDQP